MLSSFVLVLLEIPWSSGVRSVLEKVLASKVAWTSPSVLPKANEHCLIYHGRLKWVKNEAPLSVLPSLYRHRLLGRQFYLISLTFAIIYTINVPVADIFLVF